MIIVVWKNIDLHPKPCILSKAGLALRGEIRCWYQRDPIAPSRLSGRENAIEWHFNIAHGLSPSSI